MAGKHHKSKSPASINRNPQARDEIIENERIRLMKAHAILGCVQRALESDGMCTGVGPYWPAAIEAVGELINETIRRLEDLEYPEAGESLLDEVRENIPVYETGRLH
jgi:hypothetical protein